MLYNDGIRIETYPLNAPANKGRKKTATPMVEKSSTATPTKAMAAMEYVIAFFMLL